MAGEYATPGESLSLTLADLVEPSSDVVNAIPGGYEVNGLLTISLSDQLVIEPGTLVRIRLPAAETEEWTTLTIDGSMEAIGIAASPIIFEVTPRYHTYLPWTGLYHRPGSGPSHYRHCIFQGGGIGILCRQSAPDIRDCTFSGHYLCAIAGFSGAAPTIVDNLIENARQGIGISISGCPADAVIENNMLRRLEYGIFLPAPEGCTLRGNQVEVVRKSGVSILGGGEVSLVDHTISGCADGILTGGTGSLSLSQSRITGCTFTALLQMDGFFSRLSESWIFGNGLGDPVWGDGTTGGIQLFDHASGDLGLATAPGHNFIFGNQGGNLLNFTEDTILAIGNRWDSPREEIVAGSIWDAADDSEDADGSGFLSGTVLFEPVWTPRTDLFNLSHVWQATDEAWDLAPSGSIDADDLYEMFRIVR